VLIETLCYRVFYRVKRQFGGMVMSRDILNNWVSRNNLAIRFSQKFSLNEKRILGIGLAFFDSRKKVRQITKDDRTFRITVKDFITLSGVDPKHAYRDMESAASSMRKRYIAYKRERPVSANKTVVEKVEVNWFDKVVYSKGGGYVILSFSDSVLPYITELKGNFTTYRLKQAEKFRGLYTWDLLDLLLSYRKKQHIKDEYKPCTVELSVDELRDFLQIPESYKWQDIKRRVIEASKKELTTKDNWNFKWVVSQKFGRSITHVEFTFNKKQQRDLFK